METNKCGRTGGFANIDEATSSAAKLKMVVVIVERDPTADRLIKLFTKRECANGNTVSNKT